MRRIQILPLIFLGVGFGFGSSCTPLPPDNTGIPPEDNPRQCVPGVTECGAGDLCDDGDQCTVDACEAGCCTNVPRVCDDDGLFCNGDEYCDPGSGECRSGGNPCRSDNICNEESKRCDPQAVDLEVSINGCPGRIGEGDSVGLVAVARNASGSVSYRWTVLRGSGSFDEPESRTPTLTPSSSSELEIQVTAVEEVSSGNSRQARATCTIDVTPDSTEPKRNLPACFQPATSATISIDVPVPADVLVVGLRELPPTGWSVSNISDGGQWDVTNKAVKWFFFDDPPQTVSYAITPTSDAEGVACFSGRLDFDGVTEATVGGPSCLGVCSDREE